MKLFTPKKFFIIVAMLVCLLGIPFLNFPSQNNKLAIAIMVGVDLVDNKVEVSMRTVVPSPSDQHSLNEIMLQGRGRTMEDAIGQVSLQIGKEIGLAHCNIIALGDSIVKTNIEPITDYFVRTKKVGKNAVLVSCGESASQFVQASMYVTKNLSRKIQDIVQFNIKNMNATDSTIDNFYKGFYSRPAISVLPRMYLSDEEGSGLAVEVYEKNLNRSSTSVSEPVGNPKIKYLVNSGKTVVTKKGKQVYLLNELETKAFNYFQPEKKTGEEIVTGVNDDQFENATLVLSVVNKESSIKTEFVNSKPKYTLDVNISVLLEEIVSNDKSNQKVEGLQTVISPEILSSLTNKVKADLNKFVSVIKTNNIDIVKCYESFYKRNYNNWTKYEKSLVDTADYLSGVEFVVNVSATSSI